MPKNLKTDVLIIGAGISGLATAHFLENHNVQVNILEKESYSGGNIRSQRMESFLVEYGPNSTLDTTPLLHQLLIDLDIENFVEYAKPNAKKRYIVRNGQLNALPMGPLHFLKSDLFSKSAKLRLLKEPFISPSNTNKEESLADFVKRRLGQEFLDYAINPFVAGVYAGVPEKLSVRSAFPKLYELEQTYGSLFKGAIGAAIKRRKSNETPKQRARLFSFQDGMQTIIDALVKQFSNRIYTDSKIDFIRKQHSGFEVAFRSNNEFHSIRCSSLLFVIPTHSFAELNFEFNFPIRNQLNQVSYPPVTMVFFGYHENPAKIPLDGFGFLIPEKENRNILGTIWSSTLFSNRAPTGGVALTTYIGGSRQPENALKPKEQIINMVEQDLQDLMGIDKKPDFVEIKRWDKAIPQYNLGHQEIIDSIEACEKEYPGLYLSGNFRGGISVGDCVKQANVMSEQIASDLEIHTDSLKTETI